MAKQRNYVAKHMNTVNRNSIHKNTKYEIENDHNSAIEEGITVWSEESLSQSENVKKIINVNIFKEVENDNHNKWK